jgi:hypothetical protein
MVNLYGPWERRRLACIGTGKMPALTGLQPHKTAPFVGCVNVSTASKHSHTPLQSGRRHTASEQAVAYLRETTEAKYSIAFVFAEIGRYPTPSPLPPAPSPTKDSDGKVRAEPRAKAQRRKGPGRRWCLPSESTRGEGSQWVSPVGA